MTEFPGVSAPLAEALAARGYTDLTPVQTAMLDPELYDRDLLVSAQTGSGKTVAFGIAIADTLLSGAARLPDTDAPLALVIAPTRELALQVQRELEWLYAPAGARIASCVGGMDIRDERRALSRGAHIVVGTPGRLVDHVSRGSLDMTGLRAVILDEADEMLDLGFRDELETLLAAAAPDRRTLMFSATVSKPIAKLAATFQRDAVRVNTASAAEPHKDIDYRAYVIQEGDAENAIINVLRYFEARNALVFCATREAVNRLTARFQNRGFSVVALSGEFTQKERTHALQAMRDGRARVCVATDVAARGIDLPDLELVIHADLPRNNESLLHRSGRTGRAGRKGTSALIIPSRARRRLERLFQDANVEPSWLAPPSAADVEARDNERLLSSPLLSEPAKPADLATGAELIARYGAETIAAAFVRQQRGGLSAPEDLAEVRMEAPRRRDDRPQRDMRDTRERREPRAGRDNFEPREPRAPRDTFEPRERTPTRERRQSFDGSAWMSLSVGRRTNADPKWLLPMLCKSGGLSRADIGAIRIEDKTTYVELTPDAAERLFATVGSGGTLEKSIRIFPVDGPPEPGSESGFDPAADTTAPRRKGPKPRAESGPRPAPAAPEGRARPKYRPKGKDTPQGNGAPTKKYKPKTRRPD